MASDCLFCAIVAGDVPAGIVHSDEHTIAFTDINPQAPTHVLVVPREHVADIVEAGGRPDVAATAAELGLDAFRTVFNTGAAVGQSVFHVHAHLLAGRPMGWPPG